jgi:export-related chaperone CsaA
MVTIDEFAAIDLRVGRIIEVEDLEGARKPMYRLKVDLGAELGTRNLAAGLKNHYTRDEMLGRYVVVVANLAPKNIGKFVSEGMLLAADDGEKVSLLVPDRELKPGSRVR